MAFDNSSDMIDGQPSFSAEPKFFPRHKLRDTDNWCYILSPFVKIHAVKMSTASIVAVVLTWANSADVISRVQDTYIITAPCSSKSPT